MPHRLVDLQPQLGTVENNVELALWTLISTMQRHRFLGDPAGVLNQLQFLNQFISFVLPLSAKRIRIRPLLDFVSGKRVRSISGASRKLGLMDIGALG